VEKEIGPSGETPASVVVLRLLQLAPCGDSKGVTAVVGEQGYGRRRGGWGRDLRRPCPTPPLLVLHATVGVRSPVLVLYIVVARRGKIAGPRGLVVPGWCDDLEELAEEDRRGETTMVTPPMGVYTVILSGCATKAKHEQIACVMQA
jgi:hypothetical protein